MIDLVFPAARLEGEGPIVARHWIGTDAAVPCPRCARFWRRR